MRHFVERFAAVLTVQVASAYLPWFQSYYSRCATLLAHSTSGVEVNVGRL